MPAKLKRTSSENAPLFLSIYSNREHYKAKQINFSFQEEFIGFKLLFINFRPSKKFYNKIIERNSSYVRHTLILFKFMQLFVIYFALEMYKRQHISLIW